MRTQAHSCPPGAAGTAGAGEGAIGEREQLGPEQGECFCTGCAGEGVVVPVIGTSLPGVTIT